MKVLLVQVQQLGTITRYGFEILHQCGERVKTKKQKVLGLLPSFVEVMEEKLVGGLFAPLF